MDDLDCSLVDIDDDDMMLVNIDDMDTTFDDLVLDLPDDDDIPDVILSDSLHSPRARSPTAVDLGVIQMSGLVKRKGDKAAARESMLIDVKSTEAPSDEADSIMQEAIAEAEQEAAEEAERKRKQEAARKRAEEEEAALRKAEAEKAADEERRINALEIEAMKKAQEKSGGCCCVVS